MSPHYGLKRVQRKLADFLAVEYGRRNGVHGFVKTRSILTNARSHVRQRFVLNIDLVDFFGSIHLGRVRGVLMSKVYGATEDVATIVAQICCFEGALPQGAPTSPVITNIICGQLDSELKRLAKEAGCTYSRYCDDISFSCGKPQFPESLATVVGKGEARTIVLGKRLIDKITENGFQINEAKTRLLSRSDRQDVTGLVTNRFANVPRTYIRNVRAVLHAWQKFGLAAAETHYKQNYEFRTRTNVDFERVIGGRIQYIGSIRGFDDEIYRRFRNKYNELSTKKIPLHEASWEYKLANGIWILESGDTFETLSQGTACFLEGVGLVTCAHCLQASPYIYHPNEPTKKYPLTVLHKSDDIDLAIVSVADPSFSIPPSFRVAADSNSVQQGDAIKLAGFPEFALGSTLSIKEGLVQSIKMKSSIRRFNISAAIIKGNSGGPVFNKRGEVIGIAATGTDSATNSDTIEAHGVIPVYAFKHVKDGSAT